MLTPLTLVALLLKGAAGLDIVIFPTVFAETFKFIKGEMGAG